MLALTCPSSQDRKQLAFCHGSSTGDSSAAGVTHAQQGDGSKCIVLPTPSPKWAGHSKRTWHTPGDHGQQDGNRCYVAQFLAHNIHLREGGTDSSHVPAPSLPIGLHSQGGARPKPGAGHSIWTSPEGGRDPNTRTTCSSQDPHQQEVDRRSRTQESKAPTLTWDADS